MAGTFDIRGESAPFFPENPSIDRLFAMMLALATEISAVSDKLDTVIDILGVTGVEHFSPDTAQQARRDAARKLFVETLLAPFQAEADRLAAGK
jgi:hypothetical protein